MTAVPLSSITHFDAINAVSAGAEVFLEFKRAGEFHALKQLISGCDWTYVYM